MMGTPWKMLFDLPWAVAAAAAPSMAAPRSTDSDSVGLTTGNPRTSQCVCAEGKSDRYYRVEKNDFLTPSLSSLSVFLRACTLVNG